MSWAGLYTLHHLYCDNYNVPDDKVTDGIHRYDEFPHQFAHELGSKCRAAARRKGWIIKSDGTAICPKCSGKKVE